MGLFDFWERRSAKEAEDLEGVQKASPESEIISLEELVSGIKTNKKQISEEEAMNIPALASSIEYITNIVAILPVYLYTSDGESVKRVFDEREMLLNSDTFDTLDGFQFKKIMARDLLLHGNCYAYKNMDRNKVRSLHYVDERYVSVWRNSDVIFKDYKIMVQGQTYEPWEFIKVTRNSRDGVTGSGVLEEYNKVLLLAYSYLIYEKSILDSNGNKKGFLKSQGKLSKEAMDELKKAWKELFKLRNELMVLNNNIDFKEISSTAVEMQLNENKKALDNTIYNLLNVPKSLLDGSSNINDVTFNNFMKSTILPILTAFQTALNKDLLLDSERQSKYFAFDTREITKADIEKRYKAYESAIKSGIMDVDEARFMENMEPMGIDFTKLALGDVLYFPDTGDIYTPNSGMMANLKTKDAVRIGQVNGGEDDFKARNKK